MNKIGRWDERMSIEKNTDKDDNKAAIQIGRLEEYRTLRQEMLDLVKFQHELIVFTFTGVTAICTWALSSQIYLLFAVYILLIPLRCRHIFYQEMIIKIAAYISTTIEPFIDGMGWESHTHNDEAEDRFSSNEFRNTRIHYYMNSIIAGCSGGVISYHAFTDLNINFISRIIVICIAVVLSLIVIRLDYLMFSKQEAIRERYRKTWKTMFCNTK